MNGAVRVALMASGDSSRWDAFVDSCSEATFCHRSGWQRVVEEGGRHPTWFFYAEEAGRICGVLPLAEVRSLLFGHALVSLPFCVYGGIAASNEQARSALRTAAEELAEERGAGYLEFRTTTGPIDGYGTRDLYYTFRRPISADPEANLAAVPRKQRAVLRKAIGAGFHAEVDADNRRFYQLYADSVHRLGTPVFGRRLFEVMRDEFRGCTEVRVIVQKGRPLSAVLSFRFRDQILPYYGGGLEAARNGANDFMYWSLMNDAAARGCTLFDFGRSKLGTGAFAYKKNWGFAPQPLAYQHRLVRADSMPETNPSNPRYALLIRGWKLLPLALANRLGPPLARYLG